MKVALSIIGRVVGFFFLIFFAHRLWVAGEVVAVSDPIGLMLGVGIMVTLYTIDRLALVLAFSIALAAPASATERSRDVTQEFQRLHPCPATGRQWGACPGWIKDHIAPLCNGGADAVSNMQWQTVDDAKVKDRWERDICRKRHG